MKITAAAAQMTSTRDVARNVETALELVKRAAAMGAELVALPENWMYMRDPEDPAPVGMSLNGPELAALRDLARAHGLYLLAGTIPEAINGSDKVHNTSVLLGPNGDTLAVYRKVHLFDICLSGGEEHRESAGVEPGREAVTADTRFGRVGLSVCYDLRFPELYRRMSLGGALMFFIPAAFTLHTGRDHWTTLLRARAIENLSFVIAPAQFGQNAARRRTYGRSAIIDPWGVILAQAADDQCVITAELDLDRQQQLRNQLPCLNHTKKWLLP
jgi:predicted amidohydrolase